jgi:hypothetical protein
MLIPSWSQNNELSYLYINFNNTYVFILQSKQESTKSQLLVGNLLHRRQIYLAFLLDPPLQPLQINKWSRALIIFLMVEDYFLAFLYQHYVDLVRIPFYFTTYLYNKFDLSYKTGFYLIAQVMHLFDLDQ